MYQNDFQQRDKLARQTLRLGESLWAGPGAAPRAAECRNTSRAQGAACWGVRLYPQLKHEKLEFETENLAW